jgi:hypothetical protein
VPQVREPLGQKNAIKCFSADGIKSFPNVKPKDRGGSRAVVASLNNLNGVDKVFGDGAARNKPSLVGVDERSNKAVEAHGRHLE